MADDGNTGDVRGHGDGRPSPGLRALGRLVGTWEISGEAQGTVTYEWMEGGFFLIQHINLGEEASGMEVIGHERPLGQEPSADVKSRFYSGSGDTLDYTYEIEGDTLTIWFGDRGSPAYYRGTLSENDGKLTGAWHYPGGGGYETTSTRVR